MKPLRKVVLEGERPMSWNRWYAGVHWRKRHAEATRVHELVREACKRRRMVKCRVEIVLTVYFDKRPMDADNITTKLYVDGLVHGGLIENDAPRFVRSVKSVSETDRARPRVEIEIFKDEKEG